MVCMLYDLKGLLRNFEYFVKNLLEKKIMIVNNLALNQKDYHFPPKRKNLKLKYPLFFENTSILKNFSSIHIKENINFFS